MIPFIRSLAPCFLLVAALFFFSSCFILKSTFPSEIQSNTRNKILLSPISSKLKKDNSPSPKSLNCSSCCVMEQNSHRVLFEQKCHKKLPMASTTKIMTCIIALESANPSDIINFSKKARNQPKVRLSPVTGDQFYLKDLLYSLMLNSHNDTAVAIAEQVAGTPEAFAHKMNKKAQELGMKSTHFVTANGLDQEKHYTTAYDMCILSAYALKNPDFSKIIQTKTHLFSDINKKHHYTATNHNAFLSYYPGSLGIKTGFTNRAGYCFCGAAKKGTVTLVSTVLASGWPPHKTYKWKDSQRILDYCFSTYKSFSLPSCQKSLLLSVTGGVQNNLYASTSANTEKYTVPLKKGDKIKILYKPFSHLKAPIRKGDIVGLTGFYINNQCFYEFPLVSLTKVAKKNYSYYMSKLLRILTLDSSSDT